MLTTSRPRDLALLVWTLLRGWSLHLIVPAGATALLSSRLVPDLFDPPQMLSAFPVAAPTSAALSVVLAILVVASVPEPCPGMHALLGWRRRFLPLVRVAVLTTAVIVVFSTGGSGWTAANAMLALVGEALLAAAVISVRYSWTLPLVHGTSAALFGTNGFGDLSPWAWLLSTHPTGFDLALSGLLFVLGLVATARRRRG